MAPPQGPPGKAHAHIMTELNIGFVKTKNMKTALIFILLALAASCDSPEPEPNLVRCEQAQGAVGVVCNDGLEWTHGNSPRTCDGHDGVNYYLCPE
jgi:hypothetical protein